MTMKNHNALNSDIFDRNLISFKPTQHEFYKVTL